MGLGDRGIDCSSFLRSFCVSIPSTHWLGCRLQIHRNTLDGALDAWQRLNADSMDGMKLFRGGQVTEEYTIEKASKHWSHLRRTYLELCMEDGRTKKDRAV